MGERENEANWGDVSPKDPHAMQPELPTFAEPEKATADYADENVEPVSEERKAQARENLRRRFPEVSDDDLDEVSRQKTKDSKFEIFIQKLMEKYKWSRGACQQQLDMGTPEDIRDC